jgi:ABC-type multidrug transport system fused ATPase/permease subunit
VQEAAFFDANRSGELANRLSTDVHEVAEHLVENVSVVGNAAVTAAVAGAFMMNISPALAAITFAVVPAMAYGGTWYGRRVKKFSQAMLAALAGSTQMAMERFSGVVVVKSYNGEKRAVQEYSKVIDDCFKLARRLATAEGVYLSVIFMTSSGA